MKCIDVENWIQIKLDGEPVEESAQLKRHLSTCSECQQLHRAALMLDQELNAPAIHFALPELTEKIVTATLQERRQQQRSRRRWAGAAALAASVLLMFTTVALIPDRPTVSSSSSRVADNTPTKPIRPTLGEQVENAQARALRTVEEATETVTQARLLIPKLDPSLLAELGNSVNFTPEARSLEQTTQRVSTGLEPVTKSAQRAWSLFKRDLPGL